MSFSARAFIPCGNLAWIGSLVGLVHEIGYLSHLPSWMPSPNTIKLCGCIKITFSSELEQSFLVCASSLQWVPNSYIFSNQMKLVKGEMVRRSSFVETRKTSPITRTLITFRNCQWIFPKLGWVDVGQVWKILFSSVKVLEGTATDCYLLSSKNPDSVWS